MAKYIAVATVELIYEFDDEDIPKGYTPESWAEDMYEVGGFILDGHEMDVEEII